MTFLEEYNQLKASLGLPVDPEPLGEAEQLPTGIPYGQWLDQEAAKHRISRNTVRHNVQNSRYPGLGVHREGRMIVLITKPVEYEPYVRPQAKPRIKLKMGRPSKTGLSSARLGHKEYMRQWRAKRAAAKTQ